jgi:hypothetical protein
MSGRCGNGTRAACIATGASEETRLTKSRYLIGDAGGGQECPPPHKLFPPHMGFCRQALRCNFKHNALVIASSVIRRAKDISLAIHGYAAVRLRTVDAADKVVKVGEGPAPALCRG